MTGDTELLRSLPVAVYTTDADGWVTFYNDAAADLWGYRPEKGACQWCGSWRLYAATGDPLRGDQLPVAVSLRERRPLRGVDLIAERPDGSRIHITAYPTPLTDASGKPYGAINLLIDATERQHTEIEMVRLAAIVESSDDAIVSKTLDGRIITWNAAAERLFGYEAQEIIGESITRIIPPELHQEETEILAKLQRGERIDHFDTVRVAKDGRRIHISLTVSPLRNKAGIIVGASKVARDVTERKQHEELQRLLFDELNHRVKNTLAIVQAIAQQSLRRATNITDFVQGFSGRIEALARAHDLLVEEKMSGADIVDVVRDQVLLGPNNETRISYSGPHLMLEPQSCVQLTLVLHELATNARKYGAISVETGKLVIEWQLQRGEPPELFLEWRETGVGAVSEPREHGFGTTLITRTLEAGGGSATVDYGADGITCTLRLPIADSGNLATAGGGSGREHDQRGPSEHDDAVFAGLTGLRVLVVEDEPLIAMGIEGDLLSLGCAVVGPAGSLLDARRLIAEADFDVAVVDTNLAGHPVDDLLAALAGKGIPFLLASGYGPEGLPRKYAQAPLLKKPFGRDHLLKSLHSLVMTGHGKGAGL